MAGGRAIETSPLLFVFCMTPYVHRGSGQAHVISMYPRQWLSLSSRTKAFVLQGRHRYFVGDSAFHAYLRSSSLSRSGITICSKYIQSLMYITIFVYCIYCCTAVCTCYYCCFHPSYGARTAVGPYILHRNRKHLLMSQSTLQEEFVEKKYQVFDTIGLLLILVQVNLSSSAERV